MAAAAQPGQPGFLTYRTIPLATTNPISVGVDVSSGNLMVKERDLVPSAADSQVAVDRTYNSQAVEPSPADGALGPRWTFDIGVQTRVTYSGTTATVYGPDGYVQQLTQTANGSFTGPPGYDGTLTHNADGSSVLVRSADTLRFDASGQLSSVTNAGGTFTVANTSAAGRLVLSSFGTASGQRANFSYNGMPRVRQFQDPLSATHEYVYDSSNRLAEVRQPDGSSVAYHYDASGYLSELISRPDGTVVTFVLSSTGQVRSLTVNTPGEEPATTTFSYGSGSTIVTEPSGIEVVYSYDSTGRVTSVTSPNAEGPEAFTCEAITPEESGFVNPEVEETGDIGLAPEASVCPPGQQQEPKGYEGGPHALTSLPAPTSSAQTAATPLVGTSSSSPTYHLGAFKTFAGLFNGKAINGSPTKGAKAMVTVSQPTVPEPASPGAQVHSLAEMAVLLQQTQANVDQIEMGWIVNRPRGLGLRGAPKPQLFVFDWISGVPQKYNNRSCVPFGNPEKRVRKGAFLTAGATRRFGILHDEARHRWEIYYAGHPVCAYSDSLWSGRFVSARSVVWTGEVSRYPNGLLCPQMGNGIFGTKPGSSQFGGLAGVGGGPGLQVSAYIDEPVDPNYALSASSSTQFNYGGPGDGC